MKKTFISLALVLVCMLSACSEDVANEQATVELSSGSASSEIEEVVPELSECEKQIRGLYSEYYPAYFLISYDENLFLNKDVEFKLYIDGEQVTELEQGDTAIYGMILPVGDHKIKIASSLFNADSQAFTVGPDPYMGEIFNYFYADVRFKKGDAEITEFDGNTMTLSVNLDQAVSNFYEIYAAIETAQLRPIGEFDLVINQYECREVNDANASSHISDTMDEWEWLDGAATFQMPKGTEKEFVAAEKFPENAQTSSVLNLKHESCSASLSINALPPDYSNDSLQIFDVLTEIDIEENIIAGTSDSGQTIGDIHIEAVNYGELQVYESFYTISNAEGLRDGYSCMFLVESVLCSADFRSSDSVLLQTIIDSICLGGEYNIKTQGQSENILLNNPIVPELSALWGKWFHDDSEDYGRWIHELSPERFVTIDSSGAVLCDDSLIIDTCYVIDDVLHVYFSVGSDRNFYCAVSGNTMALSQTWNKPDYGSPVIYVRDGTSNPNLDILKHVQAHGVSVVGYDYNGSELYIGSIVRTAVDESDLQYALGAVTDVIEDGHVIVEFFGVFNVNGYQQVDPYYIEGLKEQLSSNVTVYEPVDPSTVQIHIWG